MLRFDGQKPGILRTVWMDGDTVMRIRRVSNAMHPIRRCSIHGDGLRPNICCFDGLWILSDDVGSAWAEALGPAVKGRGESQLRIHMPDPKIYRI